MIAIPEGADITLSIQANTPVYLNNYKIFPAPDHQLETTPHNTTFLQEVFSINDSLYNLNSFIPFATAEIVDIGFIRGQRIAEVIIYPVQFNPATQQLKVFSELEITLNFNGANSPVSIDNGIFSNLTQNLVLNYTEGGTGASVNDRASTPGNVEWLNITDTSGDVTADYLIIAAPEFFNNIWHNPLLTFAQHKAEYNGFDVAIANVEQIISDGVGYPYDYDNPDYYKEHRIRNFLKSVYENGTANNTHDGKLAYALLVGDEEVSAPFLVPAWKDINNSAIGDEVPADYYYSCLTTNSNGEFDNYGDMFIGRFSVDSEDKLFNIVAKSIAFETEYRFDDWKNRILLTSGKHCDHEIYENNLDQIYPEIPGNFETSIYKMESEGDQYNLFDLMNSGQLITHYRGSGPEFGWSSWIPPYPGQDCYPGIQFFPFYSSNTNFQFNNADKQGLVISVGTLNGAFDFPENCMAENFTTSETGSALFITSSRGTEVMGDTPDFVSKNDHFSVNIHKALWENLSFVAGEFLLEAQLSTYDYYNSTIANLFMLFGDPALNLMAEGYQVTESITLSGNINISTDITIADGVVVTLADDTHVNFGTRGKLIIEEMAGLIVGDSVVFTGQSPENSISIAGYLTMEGACTSEVTLKIENGSVVALNNYNTLHMGENAGIIINPGGRLEVSGSTLTTVQNTWPGITVNGNSQLPQSFQNQGALILNNGAVIKNATTAIQAGSNPMINPGNQGGIVQANNVHFINNQRDIEFNSYQNASSQGRPIDNISYVHYCQFTTDDSTLFSTHHESVQLSDVQGIVFNHCVFTDTRTNLNYPSGETKRTGIVSNDAIFRVYNSDFDQLQYGIYATSTQPNRFFQVHSSDFSTHRGIYFNGMDNVTIINNNLYVIPSSTGECNDRYGIYINQSTNFTIENNNIESQTFSSCNTKTGIIAHNSGALYNELYRNNFSGLTIGIEAIGVNRGYSEEQGLEIKCNQFENNMFDIFVTPYYNSKKWIEGIRELQGYNENSNHLTTSPAGNLFGNNSPVLISNFINEAERLFYFHHVANEETRLLPNHYSQNIFLQETGHKFDYENSCPDRAMQPKIFNLLIAEKQDAQTHYEETSVLLQAHVDDGNTELMSQQVEMAGEGDAYNTYQYLMQTSPYLSEEVLTSLGAKEEGFNNAMIRDVMVENPQAAKSEEVKLALDSRIDQLPAYMRWQINNGLFQFSEKEIMEQFIAYQKTRHDQALNQIIMGVMHQQEGFENAPSLDQLLAQVDDVRYQYMRAELKFAEEDYAAGLQQLNLIAQQYDLSDANALQAHQEMTDFYTLLAQWSNHEDHPGFTNLPVEVLLQLENYLEATPRVAGKALSLLMLNDAIAYEEPILYPQEDMLPKTDPVSGPDGFMMPDIESELRFGLYPNPSRDYLTLDWCIESPRLAESGKIEFRNTTGVLIHTMATDIPCNQQILPLDGWKSGTYTATLTLNNQLRKTITFVVAK